MGQLTRKLIARCKPKLVSVRWKVFDPKRVSKALKHIQSVQAEFGMTPSAFRKLRSVTSRRRLSIRSTWRSQCSVHFYQMVNP